MNWRGNITIKTEYRNGWPKHDTPYCTYGIIQSREEAQKRCEKEFAKRKLNSKYYYISVYQSYF